MNENVLSIKYSSVEEKKLKNPVRIKSSPFEYENLKLAEQYTGIKVTDLIRSLTKEYLQDGRWEKTKEFTISFSLECVIDKSESKITTVLFCNEDYEALNKIFQCVPLSSSNFIKYLIMPEIVKIVKNKRWIRK